MLFQSTVCLLVWLASKLMQIVPYSYSGGLPGDQGIQGVIDGGQAAQDYLAKSTFINGDGKQKILSGYVTGDTGFTIPGAPGSVSLVVGFETKELDTDFRPDTPTLQEIDLVQVELHCLSEVCMM